ncbi:uncharacterized protein LOC105441707 [Strongylocentrotus purpuratus]|uniref:CUB domain-containing protein n=1 Tax=Strongylocentrotus purpuratus TaxID=7668 RepID=A0A7M7NUT3_STRPU|nr:uncharacterized protein LOC105441707 [Strongylocentrotus purpuratus]
MVQFNDFDLEPQGTDGAYYDSLRVYHALTNSFDDATQRARLSGSSLPDNFSSIGSYLWLRFTSDGSETKKGFSLLASAVEPVETRLSLVPILSSTLASLSAIAIIMLFVWLVCRRKRLKHVSSEGIAASREPRESPGIKNNPTFESSNVHDLRKSDVADCHGGDDPYMALTTPHNSPTFQVYQTLSKVNSQGDGYEVPVNGSNGSEFQIRPETDYETTHKYQDPDIVGRNIPQYESHINVLQEMSKTDAETPHEYENMNV